MQALEGSASKMREIEFSLLLCKCSEAKRKRADQEKPRTLALTE
jgi:hypothetical protein